MIPGWIISTTSCFTLPPCCSSLSHIPDLNLISLWELESLPLMVWLWARQAEFSVPGTVVVVKSCLMDRRLFRCLGFFFFSPANTLEMCRSKFWSSGSWLFRGHGARKIPMSLTLLRAKENQEHFHFKECFSKNPKLHTFLSCFYKSLHYYFSRFVYDSYHTMYPLSGPQQ